MTNQQSQSNRRPLAADQPEWDDIERVLVQYEAFVRNRKTDRANRAGTTAFFLIVNGGLLLAYALTAVQHAGESPLPRELPYLSFLGVAVSFFWWYMVSGTYSHWKNNEDPETLNRRNLQRRAVQLRCYWLLNRIPLQDETPPKGVATALPLTFIALHIFLGILLIAIAS